MHYGKPVVVTDLDGTLLDRETYGFEAALPAIRRLERNDIPLVLCSSKTAAEMRVIRKSLNNRHAFVVENGGGLYLPGSPDNEEQSFESVAMGVSRRQILGILKSLCDRHRYDFAGFADMTAPELVNYTGLDEKQAELALQREYTEPILWLDDDEAWQSFCKGLQRHGLTCVSGGRFFHIQGNHDKSIALDRLRRYYQYQYSAEPTMIALGNDENDARMLQAADVAFIICNHDDASLQVSSPNCYRSRQSGPAGWNSCVNEYLDGFE